MINLQGKSLTRDTKNFNAASAATMTLNSSSFAVPMNILVDYAAFSISGARQLVCDIMDAGSNIIDRIYAGATVSALGHRYYSFGYNHQNMTAFVAVATSGASAGYLSTCLPEVLMPPGGKIKVYDIADTTASDTVSFTVTYYADNIQTKMTV